MNAKTPIDSTHPFSELGTAASAITEHSPLPMATVEGAKHIVRYGNPAFCHLLSRPLEEIIGKPFEELLPEKDQCMALLARVFKSGKYENYTELDPTKPHPVFWSYTIWPVKSQAGHMGVVIQVTETAEVHATTVAMNEALVLGALRQHELTEAAENLNVLLRIEAAVRKEAEESLRQSEARYRAFVRASSDIVYRMSADWTEMQELDGRDFIADTSKPTTNWLQDYIHPDDQAAVMAVISEAIRTKGVFEMEHRVRRVDGSLGWTFSKAVPLVDEAGAITEWFGAASDVTERKHAEQALREAEDRYGYLFNSIDEGFCVIEMIFDEHEKPVDYRFLEVNPAFLRQSGLLNATGKRISELVPYIEAYWFQIYGKVAVSGEPARVANEARGMGRWFDLYAFKVGRAEGRKIGVLFTDITERRRTEEARGRLAAIVDSSTDAIIGQTLEGLVTTWNAGAERLFGYPASEIVGKPIALLIPDGHHREEAAILERVRGGKSVEHFETVRMAKEGRRIQVSLSLSPIRDPAGTIIGASKIVRDITEQRLIAVELERVRDEATAASRAKDEFLAALSHELRTPLTPVLLLASDSAENHALPEDVRADFDTIRKNIALEARLIDDLLDLTRISRGKLKLEPEPCDVHAVLHDVFIIVRNDLAGKSIRLLLDLCAEGANVMGDHVRLQQIFWNVLRNAVHFTPEEGAITVESRTDRTSDQLIIKISDTGVGISAEDLVRIFETFSQGDNAGSGTTRRFGSLGLGLAISKTLVELHGGSIAATSAGRGAGSTFTIKLPLLAESALRGNSASPYAPAAIKVASATNPPPHHSEQKSETRGLILIVEDHAPTRITLKRLLERRQFSVLTAGSVHEALLLAKHNTINFIMSDLGLPDGDGYSLLRQLRAAQPGLQGIAVSGYGTETDIAKSHEAGFIDHLTKPVNIDTLDRALEKLIGAAETRNTKLPS